MYHDSYDILLRFINEMSIEELIIIEFFFPPNFIDKL